MYHVDSCKCSHTGQRDLSFFDIYDHIETHVTFSREVPVKDEMATVLKK